jgi:predicted dehydrogenase
VKWLIVGTGDIVKKRDAPALTEASDSQVVAVVGQIDRAKALAAPLNAVAFADLSEALQKSDATAAYVATPVHRHVAEAMLAVQSGLHVLVEKPLGISAADAPPLLTAVQKASVIAGCAYYRRCASRYAHARQLLKENKLGPIIAARMTYRAWFRPEPSDPKRWRVDPALSGGGPLADMASHMFDVLIGLLGMPRTVRATAATLTHDYAAEDSAAVLLGMPNGAQVTASFHWNSKSWANDFEIVGTEGALIWRPFDTGAVTLTLGREVEQFDLPPDANVHLPLVQDFVDSIKSGRPPAVPIADAMNTNVLLDAVYRSSTTRREVTL